MCCVYSDAFVFWCECSIMHHTWALLAVTQLNFGVMFGTFGFVQTTPTLVTDFGYPESSASDAFLVIQCYLTVYGKRTYTVCRSIDGRTAQYYLFIDRRTIPYVLGWNERYPRD